MIAVFAIVVGLLQSPAAVAWTDAEAKAILAKALEAAGGRRGVEARAGVELARQGDDLRRRSSDPDRRTVDGRASRSCDGDDVGSGQRGGLDTASDRRRRQGFDGARRQIGADASGDPHPRARAVLSLLRVEAGLAAGSGGHADGGARNRRARPRRRPSRPAGGHDLFRRGRTANASSTTVSDPATKGRIAEELRFDGVVEGGGVRWPQRIRILQNGKVFFELEIAELSVRR